jgi:drug/metabolite transporter (DMT)-like permease
LFLNLKGLDKMKPWQAESTLMIITLIWGATFIFTQIGLEYTSPSAYLLIRFTIVLVLLLAVFGSKLKGIDKKTVKEGLILGAIFGGGFLLQTFGLKYTSVPKSSFITGMVVTVTPFVYWLVERKPVNKWQNLGVIIATVGLAIFTNPDFGNLNPGDVITLVSTIFWGYYLTYMDIYTRGTSDFKKTSRLVVLQYLAAAPLAMISLLIFDSGAVNVVWHPNLIVSLAFNALLASCLVTFIHTGVQKHTTPVKAAMIFSLEPVVATIISVLYTGVQLKLNEIIGGSILLSSVFISEIIPFLLNKSKNSQS